MLRGPGRVVPWYRWWGRNAHQHGHKFEVVVLLLFGTVTRRWDTQGDG